jgi:hypothetical protein
MTLQELFRSLKERFSRGAGVPPHPEHPRLPSNPQHAPLPPDQSSFRLGFGAAVAAHDSARLSPDIAGDLEATPSTPSTGEGTAKVKPAGDEPSADPPPPQTV